MLLSRSATRTAKMVTRTITESASASPAGRLPVGPPETVKIDLLWSVVVLGRPTGPRTTEQRPTGREGPVHATSDEDNTRGPGDLRP